MENVDSYFEVFEKKGFVIDYFLSTIDYFTEYSTKSDDSAEQKCKKIKNRI